MPDKVIGLGLISEANLPNLYRGALALVMPSQYEGFGLPVVEAMACGTPVLSSHCASLPEVGGDAVAYFSPDDQGSFIQGLDSLLEASFREKLRVAGLQRASGFRWEAVAAKVSGTLAECTTAFEA